jgi:hypothetical protein
MSSTHRLRRSSERRKSGSAQMPRRRLNVYLACPISEFQSERYEIMRSLVQRHFPGAQLWEPRFLFANRADWIRQWPIVLQTLSNFVFFADPAGWIGKGVAREIAEAEAAGLPIWYLTLEESLPLARVEFGPPNESSWSQYQRIAPKEAR